MWILERMQQRRTDMSRVRRGDTPEYAFDVIEAANRSDPQLAAATGLLTMLLIAMSIIEAPLPRQDFAVDGTGEVERPFPHEPGLLCSIDGKIVSWVAVEAS
jgi:hypothetical protein